MFVRVHLKVVSSHFRDGFVMIWLKEREEQPSSLSGSYPLFFPVMLQWPIFTLLLFFSPYYSMFILFIFSGLDQIIWTCNLFILLYFDPLRPLEFLPSIINHWQKKPFESLHLKLFSAPSLKSQWQLGTPRTPLYPIIHDWYVLPGCPCLRAS